MFRYGRALIALAPTVATVAVCGSRDKVLEDQIFDVAGRLRSGLSKDNLLVSKTERNGVSVYYPRKSKFPVGLPICRIVKAQINAPVDEISAMWFNHDSRVDWDSSVVDTQVLKENDSETCVAYMEGKPGYIASARDFAITICRVPAGVVGINDFMSAAFVNVDAASLAPTATSWAVRGKMNSILLLKPLNAEVTEVTYVVEVQPNGWFFSWFVDYFGNRLADPIANMKKELERDLVVEDAEASVEEIARQRFKRHQAQMQEKNQTSIVKDVTADVEDLKKTLVILEARLQDIQKSQKAEDLDLSALEKRIQSDIVRLKRRIGQSS